MAIIRQTLISCLLSLALYSTQALAGDVLPPPEHVAGQAEQSTPHSYDDKEDSADLSTALAPPKQTDGVEVQRYLREEDKAEITEYSVRGRVFRIKVQPAGGLPAYYLEDTDGDGSFERRLPGGYKAVKPPMWVIKRF